MAGPVDPHDEDAPRVVVRDKRRIDPESGAVRTPDAAPSGPGPGGPGPGGPGPAGPAPAEPAAAAPDPSGDDRVAELTDTVQRLKAEYDNYRRRTDRDRQGWRELAVADTLTALLPVLDDIERARVHGDLSGAFGAVAQTLLDAVSKLGLEPVSPQGEAFDPAHHEALASVPGSGPEPVVGEVYRAGYRFAGRVLRPAQVVVHLPGDGPADAAAPGAAAPGGATAGGATAGGAAAGGASPIPDGSAAPADRAADPGDQASAG